MAQARHVTTTAEWHEQEKVAGEWREAVVPDPEEPSTDYKMVGAAAVPGRLFWFWELKET